MTAAPTPRQSVRKYSWLAHLPISRKILLGIVLLLGLFLIASSITLYTQNQQETSRRWTDHGYHVQLAIARQQRNLQSSQLGLRGYLLSLRPSELDQFNTGMQQLDAQVPVLRQLTIDNPLQQSRLDHFESMLAQWHKEAEEKVILPLGKLANVDPRQAAEQSDIIGDDYFAHRSVSMQDINHVLAQMNATERTLLDQRSTHLHHMLLVNRLLSGIFALLSLALGLMVISLTSRLVTHPLRRITNQMNRLAAHDYGIEIRSVDRRDEIGEIARALQVFKQMAIETAEQNWLKGRIGEVSLQLQEATTHREFGQRLTSELSRLLQLGISLFYGYDADRQRLDLLGSYGLRMDIQAGVRYVPGEGLVGQCALDHQPILLDQVPEDYLRIDSGSGAALPHCVTILPVLLREQLIGVLELASFAPLTSLQRELLDALLPLMALTLENLNRAVSTQELLEQTREQADDLRVSGITLRQQQEALTESNESLQRKTMELEEQSQRLLASEEELRVQADELQASNEELRLKTDTLREQKRTLQTLQRDTEEKAAELARASQYKSEFLANMSHELRTPLNSLLILSRSLADNRDGNLDDEQVESARIINDAGTSLLRLINDILDLSKIEAGKMELSAVDYPLAQLAQSLRRNFDHVARDKQVAYEVVLQAGLPEQIHTDPGKLEQIANNLLSNAFKFTSHGTVRAVIGRPAAELPVPAALLGQPLLAISVQDSGIGIPEDKQQRIFNAFEQVDASTSRHYGGTGLGLSISRQMAELLGGDVVLQSQIGTGSTFTLLLPERAPANTATKPPEPAAMRRPVAIPAMPAQNIGDDREHIAPGDSIILVVEDDLAYARILAGMARQKNYRVLHAADGESALELARRFRPLGILLDVMLPGMDGWTVIERLKAEPATRHIPVHFLSAIDETERSRELGAVGFLTKPVSREALDGAFERLLHFAEGRPRRLLVVDDEADARSAVRSLLRQDDVSIDEAGSAEEALQKIAATGYDCIVLDLGLPGMSGLELLQQLAREGSVPPVVVYSGRELSREENLALRQYTDSIVIKGVRSPERLLDEVSLFLHSIHRAPEGASTGPATDDELKGRHVLVVDDDMRNLFALAKVLRDWGIQVSMAQDAPKALAQLDENDALELVLMDIMMPGMDGYEAIRTLRAKPRFAQLPVIALTAKAMRGDREKCLEAGANDYLSKPIDIDKLASMIRVWLRR